MVAHIPVWVFVVLVVIVYFGVRQSQPRVVAPRSTATVALLMFGLSLHGVVAAFGADLLAALLVWALGIVAGVTMGRRFVGPHGMRREAAAVRVPGSWLPLCLMLAIFALKFALGFASAMRHPIVGELWFSVAAAFCFGLLSGVFTARALVVRAFARDAV